MECHRFGSLKLVAMGRRLADRFLATSRGSLSQSLPEKSMLAARSAPATGRKTGPGYPGRRPQRRKNRCAGISKK